MSGYLRHSPPLTPGDPGFLVPGRMDRGPSWICGSVAPVDPFFNCTLLKDHEGDHAAGDGKYQFATWSSGRDPLSPPNPAAAIPPDQYTDQFRATVKHEGCETCGRGKVWEVRGLDGVSAKRFRGEKAEDEAEELAYYMSRAFERGIKAAKKEGSE